METLSVTEADSKKKIRDFIFLPSQLHKHHQNWIPPIYADEWRYFNKKKNPAFSYCDTLILLARRNNIPVGRIMGIINTRDNRQKNTATARFSFFDCIDDQETSHLLFAAVENWAFKKGMDSIIGPFGMYYHDPIGFMVEGFREKPAIATWYNFEYIINLVEKEGYKADKGLVVYKIPVPGSLPPLYQRLSKKILSNEKLRLVPFRNKRDIRQYIIPILELMNETYEDVYGFVPLDRREMLELGSDYIKLIDPGLLKVVEYDGELAGFMVGMPNLNDGIIRSGGHLFPFGFLKILQAARKSRQLDLLIGAIKKKYRGLGIDVMMGMSMFETAQKRGYLFMDSHLELESNFKVRAEMEKTGGSIYKRYMIYSKQLTCNKSTNTET